MNRSFRNPQLPQASPFEWMLAGLILAVFVIATLLGNQIVSVHNAAAALFGACVLTAILGLVTHYAEGRALAAQGDFECPMFDLLTQSSLLHLMVEQYAPLSVFPEEVNVPVLLERIGLDPTRRAQIVTTLFGSLEVVPGSLDEWVDAMEQREEEGVYEFFMHEEFADLFYELHLELGQLANDGVEVVLLKWSH